MQEFCYTCLNQERKVRRLDSFMIKSTLWEWFDAGGSGNFNVNVDNFKLCWECYAMIKTVNKFKRKVFNAQVIRLKVARKKAARLVNLSKLTTYSKDMFDATYVFQESANGFESLQEEDELKDNDTYNNDSNEDVAKKKNKIKRKSKKHIKRKNKQREKRKSKRNKKNANKSDYESDDVRVTDLTEDEGERADQRTKDKDEQEQHTEDEGKNVKQNTEDIDDLVEQRTEDDNGHAKQHTGDDDEHVEQSTEDKHEHVEQHTEDEHEHVEQRTEYENKLAEQRTEDEDEHAKQRTEDDEHVEQRKEDEDELAEQCTEDKDEHAKQRTEDDEHVEQRKEDEDELAEQRTEDKDMHVKQHIEDVDEHAEYCTDEESEKGDTTKYNNEKLKILSKLYKRMIDSKPSYDSNVAKKNHELKFEDEERKHKVENNFKNKSEKHAIESDCESDDKTVIYFTEDDESIGEIDDNGNIEVSIVPVRDFSKDEKLSLIPHVRIERVDEENCIKVLNVKIKNKKRKLYDDIIIGENLKNGTKRKKLDATNAGYNVEINIFDDTFTGFDLDTNQDDTSVKSNAFTNNNSIQESSDDNLVTREINFLIVRLTEEQMLAIREMERNERIYAKSLFKCDSCIIGFLKRSLYEKHNSAKHSTRIGDKVCSICQVRFKKDGFLMLHLDKHYRSYRCRLCQFIHHRRYLIEAHVANEHGLKPSHICPECDTEFDTPQILQSHFEAAHKEWLKCNPCGEKFDNIASLKQHFLFDKAHSKVKFPSKVHVWRLLSHICALCSKGFSDPIRLKTHIELKHPEITVELPKDKICPICRKGYFDRTELIDHLRTHAINKSFLCEVCGKFVSNVLLKKHVHCMHD